MDPNDPEKRMAGLERQLAEQRRMAQPEPRQAGADPPPVLTAEVVRNVAFSDAAVGERGYNHDEVDAFLEHVEAALQDPRGRTLTPEQVRHMAFSKPPIGKRGYNEAEVDAFLDLVEAALVGPRESDTFGMRVSEESAAPGEQIRCQLFATLGKPWRAASLPNPSLAIDVGKDAIRVIDPSTNALIASASLAQVTATAENFTYVERAVGGGDGGPYGGDSCMMPVLVVTIPGVQPLTIQPRELIDSFVTSYRSRFSWRGKVPGISEGWGDGEWVKARRPAYAVPDAEWLTLVETFGLGTLVVDESGGRLRIELVIVLAFVALSLALILWAVIH